MKVRPFGQRGKVIVPKSWVGKKVYIIISDYSNLAFTNGKLPTPEEFKMYDLESERLLPRSTRPAPKTKGGKTATLTPVCIDSLD